MITVKLTGGLGNKLFELASLEGIAQSTNRNFYLDPRLVNASPHSKQNYFNSIFKLWNQYASQKDASVINDDKYLKLIEWTNLPPNNVVIYGYLQRWEYIHPIREKFVDRLSFNKTILNKYPDIGDMIFVHIRGGDYIGSAFHHVKLTDYYKKCLDAVHPQRLILFTNDKPYAMKMMEGRSFVIADENEEDSLYLMSKCKGGIMGNSTFAWWGAYLNPDRQIFMPSKWFLDDKFDSSGYFFPGATVVEVR